MRCGNRIGVSIAAFLSIVVVDYTPASAQGSSPDNFYYYVANTRPPDAFLALRTHPTSRFGLRIMAMPNGTFLQVLQRRADGWWNVRVVPSGQEGWALSGQGNKAWIECCATASINRAANQTARELVGFKTPSDNIHCQVEQRTANQPISYLRCDIRELYSAVPPKPRDCDFDWGQAFSIAEDGRSGQRMCHSDTVADDALLTLTYGNTWQRAGYTCKSEPSGLTCINASGHGFSLSKNSQRLF